MSKQRRRTGRYHQPDDQATDDAGDHVRSRLIDDDDESTHQWNVAAQQQSSKDCEESDEAVSGLQQSVEVEQMTVVHVLDVVYIVQIDVVVDKNDDQEGGGRCEAEVDPASCGAVEGQAHRHQVANSAQNEDDREDEEQQLNGEIEQLA